MEEEKNDKTDQDNREQDNKERVDLKKALKSDWGKEKYDDKGEEIINPWGD